MAEPAQAKVRQKAELPVRAGKPTQESTRRQFRQQIPYKNYAGFSDALDQRAATWVLGHREQFRSRMGGAMQRWATNWAAANGESVWQEHEDDIHIPETKKAVDGKAARVEEALFDFDPIFEVEGVRGDLPRWRAGMIGAYTRRQMELANYRRLVQPVEKDTDICNLGCVKVQFEQHKEFVIDRKIELKTRADGTEYREDVREISEKIAKRGVVYRQVDPFWLIFDLEAANEDECGYIGDESLMFYHQAEQMAADGFFSEKQVKKVVEKQVGGEGGTAPNGSDNTSRADWPDQYKRARSIVMGPELAQDVRGEHGAARGRCIEMWGWFNFGKGFDGVTDPLGRRLMGEHRVVVTLFEGVPVRFQLNFYDRKFAPYAIGRVNVNGHEMVAPSPLDAVVQTNALYDATQSNVVRMFGQAVAPIILAEDSSDLPDSILGIMPGTVLRNTGKWDIVKMPDPGPFVQYMHQYFRRECEESSGVLRVFESPQGTATETNRKVQEQQRMIRPAIRANGELWRRVALLTHWISAQFSSQPERFAVVGKGAGWLGKSAMMTPEILQEDVDFRFIGLSDLHTFGDRQNGMTQWANRWGPMFPNMPGMNMMALAKQDYELSVGRAGIEEIFPDVQSAWDVMTQEEENEMILAGHEVGVSKQDDDKEHIKILMKMLSRSDLTYQARVRGVDHLNLHIAQGKQKEAEQRAKMLEAEQNAQLMAPLGGAPGQDRAPPSGGMEAKPSLPGQQPGVTPGPTQPRTTARTGREGQGISQEQTQRKTA